VQEVQARYPRALPVQRVLGEVYLALRKSREALGSLDRALAGNPEDARACCARSIVNQIQGDTLAALAWYRRACDLSPDDKMLRAAYRELAANLGQPPYAPSRMGLARLYLRGDLFAHAIREFETLVAEQSDALEAQVGLAESLWRADQFGAATEWCRRLLANSPSCVKALLILAVIEHDAGHVDEAQRLLRRASELDPDQQIAQTVFADRLDSGDGALRTLLFGEDALGATVATDQAAALATGRPSVHSLPLNGAGAEPATERLTTPTAPPPRTGPLTQSSVSTAARTSALPPDFHTIFAETEYMLWGHDESGNPGTPAGYQERSRTDTFAHSAVVVPPALREQGGGFDDTESRVAMNWINWLQALGARPLDGRAARPGTGPLTGPIASSTPPWSGHTGPLVLPPIQTGPLPPPTPEALRRMFAELEPEAVSRRVVDGNIVEASSAASDAPGDIYDGEREAARSWSDSQASTEGWTLDSGLPAEMRRLRDFEAAPAALNGDPFPETERDAVDEREASPVSTLESLEQGFTASGFSNMELRPGELATLAGQPIPREADDVAPSVFSGPLVDNGAAYAAPTAPPEPEPARADDEPEPSDYAGRLDRARGRRANGQLEDALGEYRVILKNAPDLLAEIVSELQESMMAAPENPEVHRLLGDARIREGDYLSALESYNRAVALTQAQGM
jgi:tetratricopeptide (TPR) repeat protein